MIEALSLPRPRQMPPDDLLASISTFHTTGSSITGLLYKNRYASDALFIHDVDTHYHDTITLVYSNIHFIVKVSNFVFIILKKSTIILPWYVCLTIYYLFLPRTRLKFSFCPFWRWQAKNYKEMVMVTRKYFLLLLLQE